MKKFFITLFAIMAVATSSFSQIRSNTTWNTYPLTGTNKVTTNVVYQQEYTRSNGTTNVVYQQGYTRSNGTYVQGHYKTKPNSTNKDNFSTVGNINIYTGKTGNIAQDYSIGALNYGSGRAIYTGPSGGQYYINSNGNKTYVPKRKTSTFKW